VAPISADIVIRAVPISEVNHSSATTTPPALAGMDAVRQAFCLGWQCAKQQVVRDRR